MKRIRYHGRKPFGGFGGGISWQRFAYKKASRSKMLYAGLSGRYSRRTLSKKLNVTPTISSPVKSVA